LKELKNNLEKNSNQQEEWLNKKEANLIITEEFFHHHAYEIITTHEEYVKPLRDCLKEKITIEPSTRSKKDKRYNGIKAEHFNKQLRHLLKTKYSEAIKFEVDERLGVFYFQQENDKKKNPIGGFDFAILNDHKNLVALRNICFGELQYAEGSLVWEKFLNKNQKLSELMNTIKKSGNQGENIGVERKEGDFPLLVGEIQFGNWALAYRDFFKVLKANVQNSIDCLIYIAPTGNLEKLLSDGIVTFSKTKLILKEFEKVISVPVWLIGLDIKIK